MQVDIDLSMDAQFLQGLKALIKSTRNPLIFTANGKVLGVSFVT